MRFWDSLEKYELMGGLCGTMPQTPSFPMSQRPTTGSAQTGSPPHLSLVRGGGQLDDAELVRLALARDPKAAVAIWDRHSNAVRGLLRRTLGNADVDDDTQEVFLRLFPLLPRLREPAALRSFIIGVAIRVAKKRLYRRRVTRWLTLTPVGELPEVVSEPANPEATEVMRRFYRILDDMNAESRVAFVLRHVEGMGLAETAQALQVSPATAKRRLARALADTNGNRPTLSPLLSQWILNP